MLPAQQISPWQLASIKEGPRNLPLKFGQNRATNSWDTPDKDKCCHFNFFYMRKQAWPRLNVSSRTYKRVVYQLFDIKIPIFLKAILFYAWYRYEESVPVEDFSCLCKNCWYTDCVTSPYLLVSRLKRTDTKALGNNARRQHLKLLYIVHTFEQWPNHIAVVSSWIKEPKTNWGWAVPTAQLISLSVRVSREKEMQ